MQSIFWLLATAAALAGCNRTSPDEDPANRRAMVAGGIALSTISTCLLHMERARSTSIPECDAGEEVEAFREALLKVKKPDTRALLALEARIERAKAEAIERLVTLAMPPPSTALDSAKPPPVPPNLAVGRSPG